MILQYRPMVIRSLENTDPAYYVTPILVMDEIELNWRKQNDAKVAVNHILRTFQKICVTFYDFFNCEKCKILQQVSLLLGLTF